MSINSSTLQLNNGIVLKGISFAPTKSGSLCKALLELNLLDLVDCARVPFAYVVGPSQDVWTEDEVTSTWFVEQLSPDEMQEPLRNGIGVLAKVVNAPLLPDQIAKFSEVLFFASPATSMSSRDHHAVDEWTLKAVPICSSVSAYLPSPPSSPHLSAEIRHEGYLLPSLHELQAASLANDRKRKQVSSVFDEATERRRKAKRPAGDSVAAAASLQSRPAAVNVLVGHKRPKQPARIQAQAQSKDATNSISTSRPHSRTGSISGISHPSEPPRRMLSRSPSMSSDIRPVSRKGPLDAASKRSTLSRVSSLTDTSTTEERNKDSISRLVMAGMRLYGLQQSRRKPGHARRASEVQAESTSTSQEDTAKDEEYKLIYHQTYKGTVFAFRKAIASEPLFANPDLVQDTVDKLLAIFCADPMAPP